MIEDLIVKEKVKLLDKNIEPKYIYLGKNEMLVMKEFIYRKFDRTFLTRDKPEFMGLKLFDVDIDSHFNIC